LTCTDQARPHIGKIIVDKGFSGSIPEKRIAITSD
jgi:hypothetical protein